jgi:diguanylate cyclase (GGDEF)-like protein
MQDHKKIKVLILEDSPTQAVELEYILEKGGYSSVTVVNGKKALDYLNDSSNIIPDIIISDIVMPEMNGFDFCRAVKNSNVLKNIPIILLTSLANPSDVILGLECGADNFITKPYKEKYLLSRIKYLLDNYELRKNKSFEHGVDILFEGKKFNITSERTQILDLLVSSFENTVQKNNELNIAVKELKEIQKKLLIANKNAEVAKKKLNELATYDALTGIFNRRAFEEIAEKMLALGNRKKKNIAVLHLDIDNFKSINDSMGHSTGDEILKITVSKLTESLRKEDIVGRIGGDEFAVVLMDVEKKEDVHAVINKIIDASKKVVRINNIEVYATLSLGATVSNTEVQKSYKELLKEADIAMYDAKKKGKNQYRIYNSEINFHYTKQLEMEVELNTALRENEFSMVYQPIIDLSNGKIVGVESLIRWNNKKLGNVSPAAFIPFAEDSRQIHDIGIWVMDEVLRQYAEWLNKGLIDCFVTFNVSPVQFERQDFVDKMLQAIKKYKLDSTGIVVEITETAYSQFLKADLLLNMKEHNVLMAIDDFGSGYSSIKRLLELPLDFMKIDGANIQKLSEDPKYKSITKNILAIAKSIKVNAIAECVETKDQAEFLIENGCEYAQGYYYFKPLKPEDVTKVLTFKK